MYYFNAFRQRRMAMHQEDDTPLGVTWRDSAQLGAFGRIGHLGKYTKTRQFPQILMPFTMCPQVICQARVNLNAKSTRTTLICLPDVRVDHLMSPLGTMLAL